MPAATEKRPKQTAPRRVPEKLRATRREHATGTTIMAATRRMPTMRMDRATVRAVRTLSHRFRDTVGRPATRADTSYCKGR